MEQHSGGENATLDRVLDFFKELRRNSEWAQLHLETTVTGDLAVNLSVRCPAAVSSSGVRMPRTGGVASPRTTRTSPSRARRNLKRRQEFLSRKKNTESRNAELGEAMETGSRDNMDLEIVANPQETADDKPAEETEQAGECIWRQNGINSSGTSTGDETLLENKESSDKVMVKIHGEFSVNPETVFKSQECFDELRDDFLDYYKVELTEFDFLSSEPCNTSCPTGFGESCSTVTTVTMKMKPGSKFPDNEFAFSDMKTFRVAFPCVGLIS